MIDDELIKIWKSSPRNEQVKFEKSKMMMELQGEIDSFNKGIKWRDWREIGAAIIVLPFAVYQTYIVPHLISKLGGLVLVCWCFYVVYKLFNAKKQQPSDISSDYLTYLKNSKTYLKGQKELLEQIFYWYVGPFLVGMLMFFGGFLSVDKDKGWAIESIVVVILFSVFLYFLNKRTAKKDFDPKIEKIDTLINKIIIED